MADVTVQMMGHWQGWLGGAWRIAVKGRKGFSVSRCHFGKAQNDISRSESWDTWDTGGTLDLDKSPKLTEDGGTKNAVTIENNYRHLSWSFVSC